ALALGPGGPLEPVLALRPGHTGDTRQTALAALALGSGRSHGSSGPLKAALTLLALDSYGPLNAALALLALLAFHCDRSLVPLKPFDLGSHADAFRVLVARPADSCAGDEPSKPGKDSNRNCGITISFHMPPPFF